MRLCWTLYLRKSSSTRAMSSNTSKRGLPRLPSPMLRHRREGVELPPEGEREQGPADHRQDENRNPGRAKFWIDLRGRTRAPSTSSSLRTPFGQLVLKHIQVESDIVKLHILRDLPMIVKRDQFPVYINWFPSQIRVNSCFGSVLLQ